jgi:hypothetical protein
MTGPAIYGDPHLGWAVVCILAALLAAVVQLAINNREPPDSRHEPPRFPLFPLF